MSIELILIRHAETHFNREGRFQGHRDSTLTEKGIAETVSLSRIFHLKAGEVKHWYVSPQGRARETSRIIRENTGIPLPAEEVDNRLMEINCGDFESKLHDELDQELLHRIRSTPSLPYPNGESTNDVMARCESFMHDLLQELQGGFRKEEVQRIVIVAHGNLLRCMGGVLSGFGPEFSVRVILHNTGVCRFLRREPYDLAQGLPIFKQVTWNDTSHIHLDMLIEETDKPVV